MSSSEAPSPSPLELPPPISLSQGFPEHPSSPPSSAQEPAQHPASPSGPSSRASESQEVDFYFEKPTTQTIAYIAIACRMREFDRDTLNSHSVRQTLGYYHSMHAGFPTIPESPDGSVRARPIENLRRQWRDNADFRDLVEAMKPLTWGEDDCILFVSLVEKV